MFNTKMMKTLISHLIQNMSLPAAQHKVTDDYLLRRNIPTCWISSVASHRFYNYSM